MANFFKAKPKQKQSGQLLTLTISKLDSKGNGVGYHNNKAIFVAGALPDETVQVKIIQEKSKYALAKLIAIENSASTRVKPQCKHFLSCGGCDLQHYDIDAQLAFKQQQVTALFSRAEITQALPWQKAITSAGYAYRRKARIGVQYNKKGQAIIGFRRKLTNELVAIKHCAILTSPLADIFTELKALLSELSQTRAIGHIEVIDSQGVTLAVRQLKTLTAADKTLWQRYAKTYQWQVYFDDGNALRALDENSSGLSYQLFDETEIAFSPENFIQVNDHVNNQMIQQALSWLALSSSDRVLDLFCGLGNFSLPMAKKAQSVIGVEGLQSMVDKAGENAQLNHIDNAQFFQANLNDTWQNASWLNDSFTHVLLDPARAGAHQAIKELSALKIANILYVSCDPATLAADSQQLITQGYKIEKIAIMDMFSQTKHIETMVLFRR